MLNLSEYIELINGAGDEREAFARFCTIMAEFGYERVAYSLLTDHPSLSLPKQHGLVSSYPAHWMRYYKEHNYLKNDPVVAGLLQRRAPFFWDDLRSDKHIIKGTLKILDQGGESGVRNGIGIPHFGANGEIVGIGLARTDPEKGRDVQFLANAYLLSAVFHQKFRSFLIQPAMPVLTDRERDVLCWAAEGKSNYEIAIILGLSKNTVKWHWKGISRKLDANGRFYCISKAILLGAIEPVTISIYPEG